MIVEKLVEHVYGLTGYSKLKYNNEEHEISWSLSGTGTWNYSTNDLVLIRAFEDTF